MLRPAAAYPVEQYAPARVAELLLNNAVDETDYTRACEQVRELGLDPARFPTRGHRWIASSSMPTCSFRRRGERTPACLRSGTCVV